MFCVLSSLYAGDGIAPVEPKTADSSESWLSRTFDGLHRFDIEAERLHSDDVEISNYALQYELKHLNWDTALTLGYTDYEELYRPAVIGNNAQLTEQTRSIQLQLGWKLNTKWNLNFTTRHYDGFTGYRSIWIAEYYRQLFGAFSSYEAPDPQGESYSVGATYSYLSGHFVRFSVGYGLDTIAPGYSFGAVGLSPSRENLYRKSATLRFEDVWRPWLKSEHIVTYVDTTNRNTRWGVSSTWHAALSEDWTLRLNLGYTEEKSRFDAEYGGLALEWNVAPKWYIFADVALYQDTGEIPNAGLITTAAPGIETLQYGIGLRWVGERSSFKVYAAIYENDYEELSGNNQIFSNLYGDRNWNLFQASYTYQF